MKKMKHVKKHPFFVTYVFPLLIFVYIIFTTNHKVDAQTSGITITTTQPVADMPIETAVEPDTEETSTTYSYRWYIDDVLATSTQSTYTPATTDYEKWIKVELVDGDGVVMGTDQIYFSKLPVVYIDTTDGLAITDKENYKDAQMFIQGNEQFAAQYNDTIEIKGRGNSTWTMYPKKPYKIKLGESTNLFGFGKNKHYVLLSNYLDESLMRNTTAFRLAEQLGLVSMETTWVDVVLNGEYVGNYQLCEHIRIDESRIDIYNWEDVSEDIAKAIYQAEKENGFTKDDRDMLEDILNEDMSWITTGTVTYQNKMYDIASYYDYENNTTGGYIFEMSLEYDEVSRFKTEDGLKVMVNSPEYLKTNSQMMNYVKEYWQDFEDAYTSVDGYNKKGKHYTQYADVDSMVSYWLVMEIMGNNDAVYKSRFAYKDIDGLLTFGPVWDFDWGCGSSSVGVDVTGWKVNSTMADSFYARWAKHPEFIVKMHEVYWEIHPYLDELVADGGILDTNTEYIKESGQANEEIWRYIRGFSGTSGDAVLFKTYMKQRIQWLDTQFATEESLTQSLTKYSGYEKAAEQLMIQFDNTQEDIISTSTPADGMIPYGTTLNATIRINDVDTSSVSIYVNGVKCPDESYIIEDGVCVFQVKSDQLTVSHGKKNVIAVVGQDAERNVTYTNYACVVVDGQQPSGEDNPNDDKPDDGDSGDDESDEGNQDGDNPDEGQTGDGDSGEDNSEGVGSDDNNSNEDNPNEGENGDDSSGDNESDHNSQNKETDGENSSEPAKPDNGEADKNQSEVPKLKDTSTNDKIPNNKTSNSNTSKQFVILQVTYKKPIKNKAAKKVTVKKAKKIILFTSGLKTAKFKLKRNGKGQNVTWSVSNSKILKVLPSGKIIAKKVGIAYVIAKFNGKTIRCKVVVKKARIKVINLQQLKKMQYGNSYKIKLKVVPKGKVTYQSLNKKVVKITKKGKIKTIGRGKAVIVVKCNSVTKKVKVRVV